eukprot:2841315-Prymnesium_polylepis.1
MKALYEGFDPDNSASCTFSPSASWVISAWSNRSVRYSTTPRSEPSLRSIRWSERSNFAVPGTDQPLSTIETASSPHAAASRSQPMLASDTSWYSTVAPTCAALSTSWIGTSAFSYASSANVRTRGKILGTVSSGLSTTRIGSTFMKSPTIRSVSGWSRTAYGVRRSTSSTLARRPR